MMKRLILFCDRTIIFAAGVVFIFAAMVTNAHAYSIYETSTIDSGVSGRGLNSLTAPFENFIQSIGSINTKIFQPSPNIMNNAVSNPVTNGLQGVFGQLIGQLDGWVYGVAGFRVSDLLTSILTILSWLLGAVKVGVDWLLALFK